MTFKCRCDGPGGCPWRKGVTTAETWAECRTNPTPLPEACAYLGSATTESRRRVDQTIYKCPHFHFCTLEKNRGGLASCADCRLRTTDAAKSFVDPLRVTDRDGNTTHVLRDMLSGGAAFLVCGGPSLNTLPVQRLTERGIYSLGVNNVAGYVPTSAFVCSDPPSKFHSSIFLDPKVMKFLPTPKLRHKRNKLRKKVGEDFVDLDITTNQCPNVWGFERRSWLTCDDTWFTDMGAAWGNHEAGVQKTGEPKTVNTMLLGLRILQYLGAKTIFLLGVDFLMDAETGPYAFGENKAENGCRSNNEQYRITADWLTRLRPVFERFGFRVYNCNSTSGLRAFSYVPFDVAIDVVRGRVEKEPFDLSRWYEK